MKYAFIALHRLQFSVRTMCRLLRVHPSGFYAWLKNPLSRRASEDKRQTDLLLKAWEESGKVHGYRKLHDDLLDQGEMCCPNRVARLTRIAGIKAQIGYKRRPGIYGGRPSVVVDNALDRQFDVAAPDTAWVTDITYIRTCEGFAYLAVVIDLYSRRVIGWAIQSRQTTDVVLQALLMAVWRRKPKDKVLIHSDQGSQLTSMDWASFLRGCLKKRWVISTSYDSSGFARFDGVQNGLERNHPSALCPANGTLCKRHDRSGMGTG